MSGNSKISDTFLALLLASTVLGASGAREASAADAVVVTPVKVVGHFKAPSSDKDGKARGISGMACLGKASGASRECFVINDEERFGEVAILKADGLVATGKTIDFVEKGEAGKGVLGVARNPMCGGVEEASKFDELDGEGVAIAGDWAYVASSHSCSGGGKYKPSSFLLVRFKVNGDSFTGNSPVTVQRSWRLADALRAGEVKAAYGKPKGEGTNIEGIAVIGDRLYAGLRTPVNSNESFIVSAAVDDLFAADPKDQPPEGLKVVADPIKVKLGANTGIRDLATLRNGRILILSGPTDEQADVAYKLWLLDKPFSGKAQDLDVTITTATKGKDGKRAKAETVTVLDETPDRLKVLVLYDNIDEGEPTQYDIPLKPQ
jgi:hypothetical protein